MNTTLKKIKVMKRVHSADCLRNLSPNDFIVLAIPTQINANLLVSAELKMPFTEMFEEIKTFKVVSVGKRSVKLKLVNDSDFLVSARAHDRRPVFITGAQALNKKMLGYV